jgi:hypothetical protein
MKKAFWFSILLAITAILTVSGQGQNTGSSKKWSASVTLSPISTFNYYHSKWNRYDNFHAKGITEAIYPTGANFNINHDINNRISVSSGINYKNRENITLPLGADMSYYESSIEKKYVFEIPLKINYRIFSTPKLFDPYIITGIRNSYFKRNYTGSYTKYGSNGTINGEIDKHEGRYILFYDLGLGTTMNLSKSVFVIVESNLTYSISGYGYLEIQGGLGYTFKK